MSRTALEIPGLKLVKQGKVRDIYDAGEDLLLVASDRVSAFDVVLPTLIPGKGEVLTQLSCFWFDRFSGLVPNHLSPRPLSELIKDASVYQALERRTMRVKKAQPLGVEAIVRGYLSGSGWQEYKKSGTVCGVKLPQGLRESDPLPEPIFTPSTKAEIGLHDENISFEKAADIVGRSVAEQVRDLSLRIYRAAAEYARTRNIIIADTKFEFGLIGGTLVLIDEVLTPDSSRFWPLAQYQPGQGQPSLDKQYVRDWLLASGWDKTPPGPELPETVVRNTAQKYNEILQILTRI
ncbi:MAG: phosphoribosylaminoimidazolesuccinocarboxamide synthase [candidate division FCPU426 bacterium]